MNLYRLQYTAGRAAMLFGLLVFGTLVSACSLRVDTRVGKRIYPSPPNNALADVPAGDELPPVEARSPLPPLSVCLPEFEAPDPAGMNRPGGELALTPQRDANVEAQAVQAALVKALRRHEVDARLLGHACRHGFVQNGDSDYYVRPTILYVEKHYRGDSQSRPKGFVPHMSPSDSPGSGNAASSNSEERVFNYEATHAIALEISVYRQGGELVFQSRQAGAARSNQNTTEDELLAISMDRLVAELRAGQIAEVLK